MWQDQIMKGWSIECMKPKYNEHKTKRRNLILGLATATRGCKVASQEKNPGITSHVLGSAKSVREWTLTLPNELPCWELESQMDFRIFRARLQGSNPSPRRIIYIIGKLLKLRFLKWTRIAHLDIWNTSYSQKKGRESNWQFDSRPLKVGNQPDSLMCKWRATYHWKDFDKGYNFASNLIVIKGLHVKLCTPKVVRVLVVGILGLPLGSSETKSH
jgi:hypothetical protein